MNENWVGNYSKSRAILTPDREAVYDLDRKRRYTYRDLDRRADILANYLVKEFGIKRNDRVAFLARNCIGLIDAYYATGKIGAILVPYNIRLSTRELVQLIQSEEPKVLFYEDVFGDRITSLKEQTGIQRYVIITDAEKGGDISYDMIFSSGEAAGSGYCPGLTLDDIHLLLHTGGTTGLPKAAMLSHRAMLFNSFNEIASWNISHTDSAHILLPLFHTGGWNLLTLPILHAGGRIIINSQFNPAQALQIIEREKTTFCFGAATIFKSMIDLPEFEKADLSSLRWAMAGAAPTPLNVMEKFWAKGIRFVLGYGMTEAGPNNLSVLAEHLTWEKIKEKHASVGKPMYLAMAKIVDDKGNEVEENEIGELLWSGPQIFSGYWRNEEETAKTLRGDWVYTGDMARRDESGFYYIVGRKKNMFVSGGENVFPPEIEKVLYELTQVREACVIGVPDEKWGEVGKAVISCNPGRQLTREEVLSHLRERIAHYKVPKYVQFIDDLPKNSVGKILTAEVTRLYGGPGK